MIAIYSEDVCAVPCQRPFQNPCKFSGGNFQKLPRLTTLVTWVNIGIMVFHCIVCHNSPSPVYFLLVCIQQCYFSCLLLGSST